jgi:hypothetical protein
MLSTYFFCLLWKLWRNTQPDFLSLSVIVSCKSQRWRKRFWLEKLSEHTLWIFGLGIHFSVLRINFTANKNYVTNPWQMKNSSTVQVRFETVSIWSTFCPKFLWEMDRLSLGISPALPTITLHMTCQKAYMV